MNESTNQGKASAGFLIEFLKWYFSKYWQVQVFAQTVTYKVHKISLDVILMRNVLAITVNIASTKGISPWLHHTHHSKWQYMHTNLANQVLAL